MNENNTFKTVGGATAIIYNFSSGGDYPWLGAYWSGEEWVPCKWDQFGKKPSINTNMNATKLDLIIYKESDE